MRTRLRWLVMTVLAITAGCGSPPGQLPNQSPGQPECEWQQKRGIVELLAIEDQEATFAFHPGNTTVSATANKEWSVGDEFKAILETPDQPECGEPRLTAIQPLTPTD